MPVRKVEIPIALPDRRSMIVKIAPDSDVLGLKRAISKAEAVEVIAAGDNADLLGTRFTAPATFRLILRGLELHNEGSLEYYHLTTKGRNQPAVTVCPKHDSLVSEDEILAEDFSVPATVAHLEEEKAEREREKEEARQAAKLRHQTFHRSSGKKKGSNSKSPSKSQRANSSMATMSAGRPDTSMSTDYPATSMANRSGAPTPTAASMYGGGGNSPTPEPAKASLVLQPGGGPPAMRQSLPPMGDLSVAHTPSAAGHPASLNASMNSTSYQQLQQNQQQQLFGASSSSSSMLQYGQNQYQGNNNNNNNSVIVPSSPTRGLAPLPPIAHQAAIFAMPLGDDMMMGGGGGGGGHSPHRGTSPDILTQMRTYLNAAEKGDAPLPQVLPLPTGTGMDLTPPRMRRSAGGLTPMNVNTMDDSKMSVCGAGDACSHKQELDRAQERIKQLEGAVDRYKALLHRLAKIDDGAAAAE